MADGHNMAMALRAAYLSMHRQADAALLPLGATANQFVVLALLAEQDRVTQRDLVERASSDPNTIRPLLAALADKGYIVREPHPGDGRAWCVRLTPRGRRAFKTMKTGSVQFRRRLKSVLRPAEARQLVDMLSRIAAAMNGGAATTADRTSPPPAALRES